MMEEIHHGEIIINIRSESPGGWLTLVSQFFSFPGLAPFLIQK